MNAKRRSLMFSAVSAALAMVAAGGYLTAQSAEPPERLIKVSAKRFDYTPSHITVKKGVPVRFQLTSEDVLMGFNLPDFNVRADMIPGKTTELRFVPDKVGTFTFLCDIFCGTGHEEMNGKLTVVA
ncbi:MAG TPA: cytochrome c oxidase subunit II [Burkholderiales bacterium]|nr:cytochrome c oxidase subunit II [Burkholderiales bacterium]